MDNTVWSCTCGYPEYVLEYEESSMPFARMGSVVECRGCKQVYANVYAMGGPNVWVKIDPADARFHRLIKSKSELEWMNED